MHMRSSFSAPEYSTDEYHCAVPISRTLRIYSQEVGKDLTQVAKKYVAGKANWLPAKTG